MSARRSTENPGKTVQQWAWLALTGLLVNGNWEWVQTPLFSDSTASLNEIVWFRLHCTFGDVLILLGCAAVVTTFRRSTGWLAKPRLSDLMLLTVLGVAYTSWSELVNLARGSWAYSDLMPLLPGTSIGVVPLVQWLVLPTIAVTLAARLARCGRE